MLVFFFPAGTVKCRGPRQKPSLQIKAICFTLLSSKRRGCRRSSCATGPHNYCNLQFYESVDPKFLHSKCRGGTVAIWCSCSITLIISPTQSRKESDQKRICHKKVIAHQLLHFFFFELFAITKCHMDIQLKRKKIITK